MLGTKKANRIQVSSRKTFLYCVIILALAITQQVSAQSSAQVRAGGIDPNLILEWFNLDYEQEAIVVPVTINGVNYPFLVDTGSSISIYDNSLKRHLGSRVQSVDAQTPKGSERFQLYNAPKARVGKISAHAFGLVATANLSDLERRLGYPVSGILGMDFARSQIIHYDPNKKCVCFLKEQPPLEGTSFPLVYPGDLVSTPRLTIMVGCNSSKPELFVVDTGFTSITTGTLSKSLFSSCMKEGELKGVINTSFAGATGRFESKAGRLPEFVLGPFSHTDLTFACSDVSSLGMCYWSRFVCTFNFQKSRIHLSKSSAYLTPSYLPLSGISIRRHNERTLIERIQENSPGAKAGFMAGDEIIRIGNENANSKTLHSIRIMLSSNTPVPIRILRMGKDQCLTLRNPSTIVQPK